MSVLPRAQGPDHGHESLRSFLIVFESLPSLVAQVIENKVWRGYQHKDFASYALDATSNGLGVNTNQRLWILRCSMDVQGREEGTGKPISGKHLKEWSEVLAKVDTMVRLQAAEAGDKIHLISKEGLETLAKNVSEVGQERITYLPSRQSEFDGHLMRLRKHKPDVFKRVVSGEMTMIEARKKAGMPVKPTDITRAKSLVRNMTPKERREFIAWLKEEGYLE